MTRTLKVALASTAVALAMSAPAPAETTAGTPVTVDTLVAHAEMIRIADAIDAAVDAKDWALARSFFTDEIRIDFTSLAGGAPATIPADALIDGWSANLTAEKASFHLRGNHRITFESEDAATMVSHGYAWNRMDRGALPENGGDALWEVWGTYEHSFTRTEDGWRVDAMSFFATAERGNSFVRNTPGS
ncbi:nuclear transport factor 2 family protein [Roseobacter sinensis]|uniref:Nuclear transport factor 2 family protein n=1 Tax=Roseobacter sinensis TaxID=2931391 RepID=A0ABT3BIH5_9RHOB|nr:nuclear transport factor 2 family protein [Roseobacter sp. WL0113]MCV3273347.1 nuclear transport factor 2 family protein [Roseobacter sp. WL0113]